MEAASAGGGSVRPPFVGYAGYDVRRALMRMFRWKCAYCEGSVQKGTLEVEHYRPKAAVAGCFHGGYWWLAWTWSNLLPTCPGCNKGLKQHVVAPDMTVEEVEAMQSMPPRALHGKATQFPVSGTRLVAKVDDHLAEGPLIIDPTRTDPRPHLDWRHDGPYAVVGPADAGGTPSPQGLETIRCLALNRVDLVQSRTQVLDRLRTQRIQIMDDLEADAVHPELSGVAVNLAVRRVLDMRLSCRRDQPYSAMASAFVDAFERELAECAASRG